MSYGPTRPLLMWGENDQPAETQLQFDERTGRCIHMYPTDCPRCGFTFGGVFTRGHPRMGESWCLRCGDDLL